MINNPQTIDLEKILSKVTIEDRVYRLRCVEAWSMVIPWQGFQLSELIKIADPLSSAKYIQFVTVFRPEEMPGQNKRSIIWPYREGLRMDEAMNPLTLLATGLYGHAMPNQNGAPIRLIVPWKYGFKSIKSIVAIRFLENNLKHLGKLSLLGNMVFMLMLTPTSTTLAGVNQLKDGLVN